jgi:hypothetical protein
LNILIYIILIFQIGPYHVFSASCCAEHCSDDVPHNPMAPRIFLICLGMHMSEDYPMALFRVFTLLAALFGSSAAFADTDCTDPISQWRSRETLQQQVEQRGWTVQRIKVDDGCYQVRGIDRKGNKVKAKYSPATLKIRSLEVEFGPDADASEYIAPVQQETAPRGNARFRKGNVP